MKILVRTENGVVHHSVEKYVQKFHASHDKLFGIAVQLSEQRMLAWHRL